MSELLDYFFLLAILLVFGVAIFAADLVLTEFDDATDNTEANQTILSKGQTTIHIFDLNFAFVLLGVGLVLFVTAFFVDTHPAFLPFNIIIYIILIFVSATFANTFITFAESNAITNTANQYENVIYIWRNMPFILTIMAGMNLVVMFAKISRARGGT